MVFIHGLHLDVCVWLIVSVQWYLLFVLILLAEVWEWEDEGKTWHAYKAGHCRLLEASKLCGLDEVSITSVGRDYTVDLKRMVQINDETKAERTIRRIDTSGSAGKQFKNYLQKDLRIQLLIPSW